MFFLNISAFLRQYNGDHVSDMILALCLTYQKSGGGGGGGGGQFNFYFE